MHDSAIARKRVSAQAVRNMTADRVMTSAGSTRTDFGWGRRRPELLW
jgi:hypothetical protein